MTIRACFLLLSLAMFDSASLPTCKEACSICRDIFFRKVQIKEVHCSMCRECMGGRRTECRGLATCKARDYDSGQDDQGGDDDKKTTQKPKPTTAISNACVCCACNCNPNPCQKKDAYTFYIGVAKKKCQKP